MMGDRGSLEQALDGILGEAMGQGILDDQFIQLRTLQVILIYFFGQIRVVNSGVC